VWKYCLFVENGAVSAVCCCHLLCLLAAIVQAIRFVVPAPQSAKPPEHAGVHIR